MTPGERYTPNSPENMSVLVQIRSGSQGSVQAVHASGKVVGEGFISGDGRCGLAVWGDDPLTEICEGLTVGEAFSLLLTDANGNSKPLVVMDVLTGDGLIYQTNGFVIIDAIPGVAIPADYALFTAYPNPFNSTTSIGYSLPISGKVSLAVYDLSGREVTRLVDGVKLAGNHRTVWSADGIASGVYVVALDAGGVTLREKVVLVK